MQFRSYFFNKDFYNAGGVIEKIKHLSIFLKKVPIDQQPDIILLGLDQNFFNKNWDNMSNDEIENRMSEDRNTIDILKSNSLNIYLDLFIKKNIA